MQRRRDSTKRSTHELKRLVEQAIADTCDLPRPGLVFTIDAVEVHGRPPERLSVWATLRFLAAGSPFCCGESGCHLWLFGERLAAAEDAVRRAMGLRQPVALDLRDRVAVRYEPGVRFHYGSPERLWPQVREALRRLASAPPQDYAGGWRDACVLGSALSDAYGEVDETGLTAIARVREALQQWRSRAAADPTPSSPHGVALVRRVQDLARTALDAIDWSVRFDAE